MHQDADATAISDDTEPARTQACPPLARRCFKRRPITSSVALSRAANSDVMPTYCHHGCAAIRSWLGGISKQGDCYLRRLLKVGATAFMRYAGDKMTPMAARVRELLEKKPFRLVSVARASKLARIVLTGEETHRPGRPVT